MNIGKALLAGLGGGMKSAADQIAATQEADNKIRLMAVEDMMRQRTAEQTNTWANEKMDKQNQFSLDAENRAKSDMQNPELQTSIAKAKLAGSNVIHDNEVRNTVADGQNPDLLDSTRSLTEAKNPFERDKMALDARKADIMDRNADLQERKLSAQEQGLLGIGGRSGGKGSASDDNPAKVANERIINIDKELDDKSLTQQEVQDLKSERDYHRSVIKSYAGGGLVNSASQQSGVFKLNPSEVSSADQRIKLNDFNKYNLDAVSQENGVPVNFLKATVSTESSIKDPNKVSSAGAMSAFQIMPDTWNRFAKPGEQINNSIDAANVAARYQAFLLNKFDGNVALAAAGYNAGEGWVDKAIANANKQGKTDTFSVLNSLNNDSRSPSNREQTATYVRKVMGFYDYYNGSDNPQQVADSGQITTDATPQKTTETKPTKSDAGWLSPGKLKEIDKATAGFADDAIKIDQAAKESDQAAQSTAFERVGLFKHIASTTGSVVNAKTVAANATINAEGQWEYNGKAIPMTKEVAPAKQLSEQEQTMNFLVENKKVLNSLPEVTQRAILESPEPEKALQSFVSANKRLDNTDEGGYDWGSLEKSQKATWTTDQIALFNSLPIEKQRLILMNPDMEIKKGTRGKPMDDLANDFPKTAQYITGLLK